MTDTERSVSKTQKGLHWPYCIDRGCEGCLPPMRPELMKEAIVEGEALLGLAHRRQFDRVMASVAASHGLPGAVRRRVVDGELTATGTPGLGQGKTPGSRSDHARPGKAPTKAKGVESAHE